jgi:hypothetical protein
MRMPQESVSLYKCLEAFLKEEPLGPEDMWLVCTHFFFHSSANFFFVLVDSYS